MSATSAERRLDPASAQNPACAGGRGYFSPRLRRVKKFRDDNNSWNEQKTEGRTSPRPDPEKNESGRPAKANQSPIADLDALGLGDLHPLRAALAAEPIIVSRLAEAD